jgi:hypothetical protein
MLQDFVGRFATLTRDAEMKRWQQPEGAAAVVVTSHSVQSGTTVRIVSFFLDPGDLGVTDVLEGAYAHGCRVMPEELAHLRDSADDAPAMARCAACNAEGVLIRMRCNKCKRPQCDECTLDDELRSNLCFYCQPRKGLKR